MRLRECIRQSSSHSEEGRSLGNGASHEMYLLPLLHITIPICKLCSVGIQRATCFECSSKVSIYTRGGGKKITTTIHNFHCRQRL
jgi:hypothetical protein